MPFRYELTWTPNCKKWSKKYRGKKHYLTTDCRGKKDREGYRRSLREFERLKCYLDGIGPFPYTHEGKGRVLLPEPHAPNPAFLPPSVDPHGPHPLHAADPQQRLQQLEQQVRELTGLLQQQQQQQTNGVQTIEPAETSTPGIPPVHLETSQAAPYAPPVAGPTPAPSRHLETSHAAPQKLQPPLPSPMLPHSDPMRGERRIANLLTDYVRHLESKAKRGKICSHTYGDRKRRLERWLDWQRESYPGAVYVEQLSADMLNRYRDHIESKGQSGASVSRQLGTLRQFVDHLEDEGIQKSPRNMSKYVRATADRNTPTFFTVDEVRSLYREADPTIRACLLLGINAGYTQIDCSTLSADMIDGNVIRRERTKTGEVQCAKLWDVTVQALDECKRLNPDAGEDEPILRTSTGLTLVEEGFRDGKPFRSDRLGVLFSNLTKAAGVKGKTFKHFRKTGANEVEKIDPSVTSQFLGHSEQSMKNHYVIQHFTRLHEVTDQTCKVWNLE